MISLKLKTPPIEDPVTVQEAKEYLRVDGNNEDSRILTMIKAATLSLENYCDQKFIEQTWIEYHDNFPMIQKTDWWDGVKEMPISELWSQGRIINLSLGTVIDVVALKTYADDNVAILFDPSNYQVDTTGDHGRLALRIGATWPTTILRRVNGVEVEYNVGIAADAASLPSDLKLAVLTTVGKFYENRGDSTQGEFFGTSGFTIPNTAQMLLNPYKRFKIRC